jgi:hypothetical protein
VHACRKDTDFAGFSKKLAPDVHHRLEVARARVLKRGYRLQLAFVTTGKCSATAEDDAQRMVRKCGATASFEVIDGKRVLRMLGDYLDGVAPPVPSLDLEFEAGQGVRATGVLQRYDRKTDIESWVFSITDHAVAELYEQAGIRLFARNIRGFLGSTEVNRGMEHTLSKQPEFFWYYNNGITIVCDDAKEESARGRRILRVTNPQIINGQQTARTLARLAGKGARGSVLVRVLSASVHNA